MTSAQTPSAVAEVLRSSPYPLWAWDLAEHVFLGVNEPGYKLFGRPPNSLVGVPITEVMSEVDRPAVEAAAGLLASGAIAGFRANRRLLHADGTEVEVSIWVRVATRDGTRFGLGTLGSRRSTVPWPLFDTAIEIAGIVTNHDWVITHVSSDIETLLEGAPETYKGVPLLGLIQPADVQALMLAVARVTADGGGATLRMHLRARDNKWRAVWCLVLALCDHSPPRLGLALSAVSASGEELTSELHEGLALLGGDVIGGMDQYPPHVPSESLSTRQWEIVTRLVRGERVANIAAQLYLSPSTVRNHLTAIYKKFGVHSQAELVAKLLYTLD
jgi:DNA-binding CsgD family transcriptional regulator